MKRVYFVRHGQSISNTGGLLLGAETPLTEIGYQQASYVAERCTALPVEIIISSTMLRAQETGRIISERIGVAMELSDLFVERKEPSVYHGKEYYDPETQRVEQVLRENFTKPSFRYADEENFEDLKSRSVEALRFLEARPEQEILVTTHAGFLHFLFSVVVLGEDVSARECQLSLHRMKVSNTGLTIFKFDETNLEHPWSVLLWNDHAHLAD